MENVNESLSEWLKLNPDVEYQTMFDDYDHNCTCIIDIGKLSDKQHEELMKILNRDKNNDNR